MVGYELNVPPVICYDAQGKRYYCHFTDDGTEAQTTLPKVPKLLSGGIRHPC